MLNKIIRDKKLYLIENDTFDEYCREKWGWNRRYAYNLIESSEVVKALPENVRNCAQNEGQARELSKVPETERVEVISKASAKAEEEARPMTARDIKEATEEATIESDNDEIKMETAIKTGIQAARIIEDIMQQADILSGKNMMILSTRLAARAKQKGIRKD